MAIAGMLNPDYYTLQDRGLLSPINQATGGDADTNKAITAALQQDNSWVGDVDWYAPEVLGRMDGEGI